jgi:hypothetical protein
MLSSILVCPKRPHRLLLRALAVAWLAATTMSPGTMLAGPPAQPADPRHFPQTGYTIHQDPFWAYFQQRGGVRTFGYPTSHALPFLGCTTQFFQRLVMQQCGTGGVAVLNLLDEGLLPYTRINGSTFPAIDPAVIQQAPAVDDPAYAAKVVDFVRRMAPDTFDGEPVNFFRTFEGAVTSEEAFPEGNANPALLPLLSLEVWGLPTSRPQREPTNPGFIYQRFQRGIMQYDKACGCTQGLLLGDYLKALVTGQNLPADLEAQARTSPLYRSAVSGILPPGTNYMGAFIGVEARTTPPPPTATPAPSAIPAPATPAPTPGQALPVWSSGHYRIRADAAVHPTFAYLKGTSYSWVLDRLHLQDIAVVFASSSQYWGAFFRHERVIEVNKLLIGAAPETIGALLLHESVHVDDHLRGRLSTFNECISSERSAAEQEAQYWRNLYGLAGKRSAANDFERQLNALVAAQARHKEEFEDFLKQIYYSQCA